MSAITYEPYGKTKDGKDVFLYTLKAGQVTVRVINVGCSVKDILVPDKDGNVVDVNLGYGKLEDYEANPAYLGCICGRVANRIAGGSFPLDGATVEVSKNDPLGNNYCHGGFVGFSRRYFDGKIDGSKLVFTYLDEDGAEGLPGDVTVTVTYELTEDSGLMMDYKATTTKPTPIDLSNHFLLNLAGHAAGSIADHVIDVNSTQLLELNDKFIPTGVVQKTEGTVMGFKKPTLLGDVLDKQPAGNGLVHTFVLPGEKGTRKYVGRVFHPATNRYMEGHTTEPIGVVYSAYYLVFHPATKRYMEVHTTEPICIAYSGYYLELLLKDIACKDDKKYVQSGGILFMPQGYIDAVNHPDFPSCILRPGETYHTTSWYKFGVDQ